MRIQLLIKPLILCLTLVVLVPATSFALDGIRSIRIGVFAKHGSDFCRTKWHPTAVYLSNNILNYDFEIVPLDFASIGTAVKDSAVDFILTNPSNFVELEHKYGVDSISTLINRNHRGNHKVFGGVIFTRADHPDIFKLDDLRGKDFIAVKESSLGGWRMAWREMKEGGMDPLRDFNSLTFGGTHEAVVYAVKNHTSDAGTVRTDTLERMASEGKIDLADFRILDVNEAILASFGFLSSTRLYPEWPMARLARTPTKLANQVAQALYRMADNDPAAVAAKCAGWTYPLSYHPVHDCLKDLHLGPYNPLTQPGLDAFFRQHKGWFVVIGVILLAICSGMISVAKFNAKLSAINAHLGREVKKRKAIQLGLLESESRLQTIVDWSIAGIFIIDPESGTIVEANKSALEMVGADKASVVGKKHHNVICAVNKEQRSIPAVRTEGILIRADGSELAILKSETPFIYKGKECLLDSFINISQLKETQANLESALGAANEANRIKDEFLTNMSHELRTPMNGIIGMTGILQNTDLNEDQAESADIIMRSSEGLLQIINDILDYSSIEGGKSRLDLTDVDLFSLIEGVVKRITPEAKERGVAFSYYIADEVPAFLEGDNRRLKQIIFNLLSNAVKFTHQGAVSFHIEAVENNGDDCCLNFIVKDTGIGISSERIEAIFNPFSQVDYSSTRKYSGTGLGLALAKHFAEMMGGSIGVESTPGKGSTFWFGVRLPLIDALPIRIRYNTVDLRERRILVVDDNATNRQVLEGFLKSQHLQFATVEDARSALAAMHRAVSDDNPFDLVVIDHMMPDMDGVDLGRAIKNDPVLRKANMILFTSMTRDWDTDEIKSVGFEAFLSKPICFSRFLNCLKLVCSQKKTASQAAPEAGEMITQETLQEAQANGPRVLVVEDNVINQKVMCKMLDAHGYLTQVAQDGRKAVNELCKNTYDIVLMDLQMPVMNGFEATSAIRNPLNKCLDPNVPIIAVTANAMKGDRQRCLDAGMDDYLSKPVDPDVLKGKIERWCEKSRVYLEKKNPLSN